MTFVNQTDFDDPQSLMRARGVDPDPDRAFVSTEGRPLFHAQTGGIFRPERAELEPGAALYRFGDGLGTVSMPHHNDNPARRLQQLYIPGLHRPGAAQAMLRYGNDYNFTKEQGLRGFLYL